MSVNADKPIQFGDLPAHLGLGDAVKALQPLAASMQAMGQIVGAAMQALPAFLPKVSQVIERMNAFPEVVREGSIALAKLGWFYDLQFYSSDFWDILDWVREDKVAEVDAFFITHYEQSATGLQERLLATYPDRAEPLRQAFLAESQGLHFVSIPVLLAQADGIAVDIVGGKLFKSVKKRPQAAGRIDEMALAEFDQKFLAALMQNGGFNASEENMHEFPHAPNRHEIMHGRDILYGTRHNYLKTLSLLAFIGLHVPDILRADN